MTMEDEIRVIRAWMENGKWTAVVGFKHPVNGLPCSVRREKDTCLEAIASATQRARDTIVWLKKQYDNKYGL